ncbi:MAG TPA: GNAT family N-acetyltransferase [Blastocatellia bacterium]|nr:GNAT family N-acetyltransferase [Blastocatellia bacterium]
MTAEKIEVEVTRTYVQMTSPSELDAQRVDDADVRVEQVIDCPASFYRYLYCEVGRLYHWVDRTVWSDDETRVHLSRPEITLWVLYRRGAPAGYFELERHEDGSTEVAYFGLLQEAIGRGLGKHLLTEAVERAWAMGAARVWLHTCTLDDPAALPNYLKRGFKEFKQEKYTTTMSSEERQEGKWVK